MGIQVVINGILLAGVYTVAAVGLNLIFGVLRVANIAHGEFLMLGAFLFFSLTAVVGISPFISFVFVGVLIFLLALAVERFLVERVVKQPMAISLLLLYGVSIFFKNLGLNIWTSNYRSINIINRTISVGGLSVSLIRIIIFFIAIGLTIGLAVLLKKTYIGKAIRSTTQNPELTVACGVDIKKVRMFTFALGAILAAFSGCFFIMIYSITPEVGSSIILKLFAVVIVGGLGSYLGTFLGALVIALAEVLTSFYISTQFGDVAIFAVFLLVLIIRPQGFLGERQYV